MILTREAGLERLAGFIKNGLEDYSRLRNFDDKNNVSQLSPYLRRRLITEQEVIKTCLEHFSYSKIEKFIQEVCWRTYWKGYLEQRPQIWESYRRDLEKLSSSAELEQAMSANTGIGCFDHWVTELKETGYLHNHARMWFASIWIFTLELPWQQGAEFFYDHLLDGDPASNTLSWRWVAGIQTKGKHYIARAENINRFTEGRFNPVGQLNESPEPLEEELDLSPQPYNKGDEIPAESLPLLVCADDLFVEGSELGRYKPDGIFVLENVAAEDQKIRLEAHFGKTIEIIKQPESQKYIMLKPHVGAEVNAQAVQIRRHWDKTLHPYAKKGYFNFKKSTEKLVKELCS